MTPYSRRQFVQAGLPLAALSVLAACGLPPVPGQEAARVHRIGFLVGGSRASDGAWIEGFLQGLHELGYVEGQSIAIEYRYGEGRRNAFPIW